MFSVREFFYVVARYSQIFSSYFDCLRFAKIRRRVFNSNWTVSVVSLSLASVECVV